MKNLFRWMRVCCFRPHDSEGKLWGPVRFYSGTWVAFIILEAILGALREEKIRRIITWSERDKAVVDSLKYSLIPSSWWRLGSSGPFFVFFFFFLLFVTEKSPSFKIYRGIISSLLKRAPVPERCGYWCREEIFRVGKIQVKHRWRYTFHVALMQRTRLVRAEVFNLFLDVIFYPGARSFQNGLILFFLGREGKKKKKSHWTYMISHRKDDWILRLIPYKKFDYLSIGLKFL